jgi:V/A-type H+-transporting ATPase subunit D
VAIKANPNRMELLKLKRRLEVARRGHKLLKDKLDELMKEFLARIASNRRLRRDVEAALLDAYAHLAVARAEAGSAVVRLGLASPPEPADVAVTTRSLMNIELPMFELAPLPPVKVVAPASTPLVVDAAVAKLGDVVPRLVELAEREKAIERLAAEIERTRRRVNALEYILLPQLAEAIADITGKLDEQERASRVRLMKIKQIVGEQA